VQTSWQLNCSLMERPMSTHPTELDRLATLAGRYASYSRSAGGLSTVIGGGLLLLVFAMNAWMELQPGLRIWLATAPVLWLVAKEVLRRAYYQRAGTALQSPSATQRRWRFWAVVYLAVMAALINAGFLYAAITGGSLAPGQIVGYVVMVALLPLVAWRWVWSVSDFLVGVLLFCQAAVVLGGGQYPPVWMVYVGAVSLLVIGIGLHEHRDYLQLRRELPAPGRS
jgi:hypothetical protein